MLVKDTVIKALPPGPYTIETCGPTATSGFMYLVDDTGRKIGTFWGPWQSKVALAELMCAAREELDEAGSAKLTALIDQLEKDAAEREQRRERGSPSSRAEDVGEGMTAKALREVIAELKMILGA